MKRSIVMAMLEKLNMVNGFDTEDLKNAKQNNYPWSMAEFGTIYM